MKIDKAIEKLKERNDVSHKFDWDEFNAAIELGIEALKRQREDRLLNVWTFPRPLPGETEE